MFFRLDVTVRSFIIVEYVCNKYEVFGERFLHPFSYLWAAPQKEHPK